MSTRERTVAEEASNEALETHASPFRALFEHWESNQWSSLELDFTEDVRSFAALSPERREGFLWMFGHRFHAEFNVATLLAPFLEHAPTYEMQCAIATQVADEHRHLECVLRIYDEIFGVRGLEAVRAVADSSLDLVAGTLYAALNRVIGELRESGDPDRYLRSVVCYHLVGEGVVARTAQNLTAGVYDTYGSFPGLIAGQRLVARDEARHIGIGVSFVRQQLSADPQRNKRVISDLLDEFAELAGELLDRALAADMNAQVRAGYNVEPVEFYGEAVRLLRIRMRSIGFLDDE